ncbi:MAG TPA: hypothetical protein PLL32_03675 [Anaeromyxobacteraceae bacterium]|nr:hypothetical protein [Anaeromyxobacteraceae bacterium]
MNRVDPKLTRRVVALAAVFSCFPAWAQTPTAATPEPAAKPAATATATPAATAEAPVPVKERPMGRELNGHLFLPSHILEDPFSYTAFGTFFGLGAGNALGPAVNPDTPPPYFSGEKWYGYTGLGLGMLLNVRILEYLSVRAGLSATAYLGTGSGAAFTIGTSARITGDVGVKGSLPVGDNFRFSAAVDAAYGPTYALLLADGIRSIIENCPTNPDQCRDSLSAALQADDTITWIAGLAGAWAPTPYLGFTANVQFIAPTKTGTNSIAQNGMTFAGSGEFDALPLVKWLPLGVNVAYQLTTGVGGNKVPTAQEAGFGFYYTGRKDMAVGLEIDWRWNTINTAQVATSTLAWLNLRYYWN